MALSALVIFLGTSWPIVSNATVEPAFYDKTNLPIAIILSLLLGLSLFTRWSVEDRSELVKRSLLPLALSLIAAAILYLFGVQDWQMLVFAFSSFFILVITTRLLVVMGKENPRLVGGPLAHVGLAVLFLGIIGSGPYGQKVPLALPMNTPTPVLGYEVTYKGSYQRQDGKSAFVIEVQKEGERFQLEPVMFMSTYNNSVMRNPDYASSWTRDFYIEPVSLESGEEHHHSHNTFDLKKGEAQTIGEYRVTFEKFDMSGHGMESMTSGSGFSIGAVLTVEKGAKKERIIPTTLYSDGQNPQPKEAKVKDGSLGFQMIAMQVGSGESPSMIRLFVTGLPDTHEAHEEGGETLVIAASVKPFINLVWLGAGLILIGFVLSMGRRSSEVQEYGNKNSARREPDRAEPTHVPQRQGVAEPTAVEQ
jgi:cytochrome c-type biogenesis protein CcmF